VSLSKPQQLRQRIGGIRRRDPGADITELRVQLREAKAEQYIQKLLAETPPLSAEERLHLTRLLTSPLLSGGDVA
jgi:hypothetical protein